MGWHFVHSIVELRWSNKGGRLASVCLTLKHTVAGCQTFERDILVTHVDIFKKILSTTLPPNHCIDGIERSIGTIFYPLWLNCTTFTSASWKDIVISLPPFSPHFGLLGLPSGLRVSFHCGRNSTTTALYYTFPAYRRVVGWQGGLRWYQYGRLEDAQYYSGSPTPTIQCRYQYGRRSDTAGLASPVNIEPMLNQACVHLCLPAEHISLGVLFVRTRKFNIHPKQRAGHFMKDHYGTQTAYVGTLFC